MKKDLYKSKEKWFSWKESIKDNIPGISKENSKLILQYLEDMEYGINISLANVKGPRSYTRLNNLREKMTLLATKFKEFCDVVDMFQITERQVCKFFSDMRNGIITRKDGKPYVVVADSVKAFKAFWHWYQRVSSKEGKEVRDITVNLDTSKPKPKWVYMTEEEIKQLCDNAKHRYKVLMMFLYDTGIRAPGELMNIKVSDLYKDCKELEIRDEALKTKDKLRKPNRAEKEIALWNFVKKLGHDKTFYSKGSRDGNLADYKWGRK